MSIGLKVGTVKLEKHSTKWTKMFNDERKRLNKILSGNTYKIYHIGSTSIPDINAKPIIDVLIVAENIDLKKISQILIENKYHKCSFQPRNVVLFKKGNEKVSTHYFHLVSIDKDWERYLFLKNYLIDNKNKREEYQSLKLLLAEKYPNNRRQYTAKKNDLVERLIKESKQENYR